MGPVYTRRRVRRFLVDIWEKKIGYYGRISAYEACHRVKKCILKTESVK